MQRAGMCILVAYAYPPPGYGRGLYGKVVMRGSRSQHATRLDTDEQTGREQGRQARKGEIAQQCTDTHTEYSYESCWGGWWPGWG